MSIWKMYLLFSCICCKTLAKVIEIERLITIILADWPKIINSLAYCFANDLNILGQVSVCIFCQYTVHDIF